jgi:hypothetical protein
MKMYGGVDVQMHVFLTLALEVSGQLHTSAALARYPLDRRLGGLQSRSGRHGENS